MGCTRNWRSRRVAATGFDSGGDLFLADTTHQYRQPGNRTRSRYFRIEHGARTRCHGESRAQTRDLPKAQPVAIGGSDLFRSSQWQIAYPNGDGLESGTATLRRDKISHASK